MFVGGIKRGKFCDLNTTVFSWNQLLTSGSLPRMRFHKILVFLLVLDGWLFAQDLKPVADRVASQNALFDEQYESDLRNFPERATAFGDYRYNDKLADRSLDAIAQYHKADQAFLARLEAISSAGFSDQDQLSHDLLVRVLQHGIPSFNLKDNQ